MTLFVKSHGDKLDVKDKQDSASLDQTARGLTQVNIWLIL